MAARSKRGAPRDTPAPLEARRLVYARRANADLIGIEDYMARAGAGEELAQAFSERLRSRCRRLAELGGTMGRDRRELGPGLRSVSETNYVIFFRYEGVTIEVVSIVHSARDLTVVF